MSANPSDSIKQNSTISASERNSTLITISISPDFHITYPSMRSSTVLTCTDFLNSVCHCLISALPPMIKHHAFLLYKQTITIIFLSKNNKRLKAQINEPRVPAYFMLYMTKLPFCPATSSRRRLILLCSAFLSPTPYSSLTSHVIRRLLYFRILNPFVLLIHKEASTPTLSLCSDGNKSDLALYVYEILLFLLAFVLSG